MYQMYYFSLTKLTEEDVAMMGLLITAFSICFYFLLFFLFSIYL